MRRDFVLLMMTLLLLLLMMMKGTLHRMNVGALRLQDHAHHQEEVRVPGGCQRCHNHLSLYVTYMSFMSLMSLMSLMSHMSHHLHIHHDRHDHHVDDHNPHNHDLHISEVAVVQPLGEIPQRELSLRLSPTNLICSAFPGPGGHHCHNKGCPKT